MPKTREKPISIKAENLNSRLSYLITTVKKQEYITPKGIRKTAEIAY